MTLEEAIRITTEIRGTFKAHPNPKFKDALQLDIEALKRFQRYRRDTVNSILDPLPGETEE